MNTNGIKLIFRKFVFPVFTIYQADTRKDKTKRATLGQTIFIGLYKVFFLICGSNIYSWRKLILLYNKARRLIV